MCQCLFLTLTPTPTLSLSLSLSLTLSLTLTPSLTLTRYAESAGKEVAQVAGKVARDGLRNVLSFLDDVIND